jgi:transposase-like protein
MPERTGTHVRVLHLPNCYFCGAEEGVKRPARYDFRTRQGPWANGCQRHFEREAATRVLGEGDGQRLLLPGEDH